ncbi:ankyrin repeat domain-containing protein 13C-like [Oppia nitens]|uniref:ankyrin repeat domain-containing protein 13C-like n=1 Tax=Oppia nitens TaxID=1686743 RepID=UPI0023DC8FDF|nr:ankyrin repeat domain-containing protein 13C-like [Oppia nitens]
MASKVDDCSRDLSLHKAVFTGQIETLEELLKKINEKDVNRQDIHGNTALIIAVMKGNHRCVELLLKSGALTTVRNELNWMSVHEAISYGHIPTIKLLNDAVSHRILRFLKRDNLFKLVDSIKEDFELSFDFQIKDYNPEAITGPPEFKYLVNKKGLRIRVDVQTTDTFHTKHEEFHLIFDLSQTSDTFVIIMVGENIPVYQRVTYDDWNGVINQIFSGVTADEEIRSLLQKENTCAKLDITTQMTTQQTKVPIFKKLVTKKVGKYTTNVFESLAIELITKTRTEHMINRENSTTNVIESLAPPPPLARHISWEEYINSSKGQWPHFGRQKIEKSEAKRVSIVVGLTDEISFQWKWIVKEAEQLLSQQLIAFITRLIDDLPKGFPVFIDYPLKQNVYMKWKLKSFDLKSDFDESLFEIPPNFEQRVIFRVERNGEHN